MKKLCGVLIIMIFGFVELGNSTDINNFDCFLYRKKICVVKTFNKELLQETKVYNDTVRLQYLTVAQFKETLGKYESNSTYNIINKYGFKGKYQFSDYLISKMTKVSPKKFLENPKIQEKAMTEIIKVYIAYLIKVDYLKYINTKVGDNLITLESLLLGCHFSPTYLEWYLSSNGRINKDDTFITIGDYMKRFEKYNTEETVLTKICK